MCSPLLLALFLTAPADAKLKTALRAVEAARFERAIPLLRSLLYPPQLDTQGTQTARLALAQSLFYTEKSDDAKVEIELLLDVDPRFVLDSDHYPPDFAQFFNAQKQKRIVVKPSEPAPASVAVVTPPVVVNTPAPRPAVPWYLNVIPFGVGQFAGGDRIGGAVWLTVELALLAANIAFAVNNAQLRTPDGYPNTPGSLPLYIAQQSSAGLFYLSALAGVLDAFLWSPQRVRF